MLRCFILRCTPRECCAGRPPCKPQLILPPCEAWRRRPYGANLAKFVHTVLGELVKHPFFEDEFQPVLCARGLICCSLEEGDTVVRASLCSVNDSVLLCSAKGQAMRFETSEAQLRASGRQSRGVKSMAMRDGDEITDMFVVPAAPGYGGGLADS